MKRHCYSYGMLLTAGLMLICLTIWICFFTNQNTGPLTGAGLEIRFLDVGQGDAALVTCDGHTLLIDGGGAGASSKLYSLMQRKSLTQLDAVVCTHPDQDHCGGLAGALQKTTAGVFYANMYWHESAGFQNLLAAAWKQEKEIVVPAVGDRFSLGSAECTFLGPSRVSDNDNDMSLVLLIRYGDVSVLFTADAEFGEEQDILSLWPELQCTILKVGHHGSSTSTSQAWLDALTPAAAVISVGSDNAYGHPDASVLYQLGQHGTAVYRTDRHGDITLQTDGKTWSMMTEKMEQPQETTETAQCLENEVQIYVCNKRSKKFHYPSCSGARTMSEQNRLEVTDTRENVIAMGYEPCGTCKP